ncbi:MAG: peroxide stress protein YaaA [Acidobacteria bacterium]|nr:peroxide stress protein YaaA [Acidobacteriota bacterium]
MSAQLFVLLPPSEAKAVGGVGHAHTGAIDEQLSAARQEVVSALSTLLDTATPNVFEKTLGVRGPLLDRALASTRAIVDGSCELLPAWQRYTGVVWAHLDPSTLSDAQRRQLLVPSGLYGLTSGVDPVADYRLKMSASLAPLGKLSSYWRPRLAPVFTEQMRGAVVVDLLPREHELAIDETQLRDRCEFHRVTFVHHDGARAVGHEAKAAKGEVARVVVTRGWDSLAEFRWNGWKAHRHRGEVRIVAPRA